MVKLKSILVIFAFALGQWLNGSKAADKDRPLSPVFWFSTGKATELLSRCFVRSEKIVLGKLVPERM